ncbi:hypothetical protein ABZV31_30290 [Streptomyces sp. NPDC005202]|uniref:hypothetical protein n=1 Tax=Streptomyces sp. NPDC005202 TaxID=3157021 RepID=UPI0033A6598C
MTEGHVVLMVETADNDGAKASDARGGSGLAGLRERLAVVDGTLEAGLLGDGVPAGATGLAPAAVPGGMS